MFETLHRKLISMNFLPYLGDIMKIWKVILLCIVIGMMAVTVVSAKDENYTVVPCIENSLSIKPPDSTDSIQYISQGQTINHYVNVGSGISWLEVDLNWGDTSDSLALTIYTPSGVNLGTFHDSYDGSVNGRIHMNIYPSQGYVEQGIWRFKVYGESVSGTQRYTFNVYGHQA